jgi:SAM-dependent methyltransferase
MSSTAGAYGADFYAYQQAGSRSSADVIVPAVRDLVRPASVIDVGCGVGTWLSAFARGGVADFLGLDGDYVPRKDLQIPADRFRETDLSQPFAVPRVFDLALSLEVAEHLPPASAPGFIASLTRLAPAVLFSAAVPHQGGWHHVNEQWPQYWAELFAREHFHPLDCFRERFWTAANVRWWYAQNTVLFLRDDHPLWQTHARPTEPLRALVHPENYLLRVADLAEATRRRTTRETLRRIAVDVASLPTRALDALRGRNHNQS